MKAAVIGAGAIGSATAAYLQEAGIDVVLVCKRRETADLISRQGLRVQGQRGDRYFPVKAVAEIEDLAGEEPMDFCFIATKAYHLEDAARRALPYIKADGLFCSLQNGVCTEILGRAAGLGRTVSTVITWGATLLAPGCVQLTADGEFIIGMAPGFSNPRLEELRRTMDKAFPTVITENLLSHQYSKLLINACMTSIGAVCGLTLGETLKRRQARNIFIEIVREGMNVADSIPIDVAPFGGRLNYYKFMAGNGPADRLRRHATIRLVGLKFRRLTSSSLQSLRRGGKTEVDYLNGYFAEKGQALGVPTPVNSRLVEMIHEIERGERQIRVENLYDPAFQ